MIGKYINFKTKIIRLAVWELRMSLGIEFIAKRPLYYYFKIKSEYLHSLRALSRVSNLLPVLKVYLMGGEATVSIRDSNGNKTLLTINRDNVLNLIRIACWLYNGWGFYRAKNGEIIIKTPLGVENFKILDLLRDRITYVQGTLTATRI